MYEASARSTAGLATLVGLPHAQPFESPSSWLTRAALTQGVAPSELLLFMGFSTDQIRSTDPDLLLTSKAGLAALKQAGPAAGMVVAARVFTALLTIDPDATSLLRAGKAKARFRFCPMCLREQRQPHLEVHCRFSPWRFCPLHYCLMEDFCAHCSMPMELPFDMVRAGRSGSSVASLAECQRCGEKLNRVQPVSLREIALDPYERLRIENGRAFLAGLYYNKVMLKDGDWAALPECKPYLKAVTFWGERSWHLAHEVRDSVGRRAQITRASLMS